MKQKVHFIMTAKQQKEKEGAGLAPRLEEFFILLISTLDTGPYGFT